MESGRRYRVVRDRRLLSAAKLACANRLSGAHLRPRSLPPRGAGGYAQGSRCIDGVILKSNAILRSLPGSGEDVLLFVLGFVFFHFEMEMAVFVERVSPLFGFRGAF